MREVRSETSNNPTTNDMELTAISNIEHTEGEWKAAQDPSSGATYYYNTMTGETRWNVDKN